MKFKHFALSLIIALSLVLSLEMGCSTTAQRNAFTTISSVEQAATAAYDGYTRLVIAGVVATNDLPKVSLIFNQVQASCRLAETTSMAGTNALSPAALNAELGDLLNLIATIVPKK